MNINNGNGRKQIERKAGGSTRFNVSQQILNSIEIDIPDYNEQQKIGGLFDTISRNIDLHQRKLESLKSLKKGYLQQMFPQKGEKTPHLRFANFERYWMQRKLGEVANYRNGKAHEQDISEEGIFIVVNSKFVSTEGNVKKYSNNLIEPLKKGDIAFVLSDVPNGRALAKTFLIDKDNMYSLNQRIAGITPHQHTDSNFLNFQLNRNSYFLKFDNGVGQTNLTKSNVENFSEYYPCYKEQQRIGLFLKQLDILITCHQNKLNLLTQLKQSYLQKMFV